MCTQVESVLQIRHEVSALVYHSTLRLAEHDRGVLLQDLDAPGEKLRGTQIIVMRPLEVLAGRQLDSAVSIARSANVLVVSGRAYARVAHSRQIASVASFAARDSKPVRR